MKSFVAKPLEVERKWFVVDATGIPLGRLATQIATLLRGKHKPIFTPSVDCGDFVIVINCEKIVLTGNKLDKKIYRHHTLYPGGLKEMPARKMIATKPERVIELAVKGMLPKNSLGRTMYKKLNIFVGPDHDHQAQMPEVFEVKL
ncbi:MAG: 50S ribosomal protein L13 [Clostridia bacterium]